MLTEDDLKVGNIYVCGLKGSNSVQYIRKKGYSHICVHNSGGNSFSSGDYWTSDRRNVATNIRLATQEEKMWYLACEKAGKIVPKPKNTKPKYFIYN